MSSTALVARRKPGPPPKHPTLAAAVEAGSVKIPFAGCWIWTGALSRGYGQLTHAGAHMTAHRASYMAAHPDEPTPKLVCHTCDVRACVNPDHLYSGDYVTNRADMLARDRWSHPWGERPHCAAGHDYATAGFYLSKTDGSRVCRQCQREAKQRQRAAQ